VAGESGISVTQLGKRNGSVMVAVYLTPCAIPPCKQQKYLLVYIFIYCLFNDIASNSDYITVPKYATGVVITQSRR
jgi:hypothetical protein